MWHSMKEFHSQLQDVLVNKEVSQQFPLETQLQRRQAQFVELLRYPPKSSAVRQKLLRADTESFQLSSIPQQIHLTRPIIEEALLLSDMLDVNEAFAVELLLTGEAQQASFPDLTRGMVAVWLFYDTRRITVDCLRLLLQARSGRMWSLDLTTQVQTMITDFMESIMQQDLLKKILDLLSELQPHRELSTLVNNKTFASRRHCRHLGNIFMETREILAECVMLWACQTPFNVAQFTQVLNSVSRCTPATTLDPQNPLLEQPELYRIFTGSNMPAVLTDESAVYPLDRVQCYLVMAMLFSVDPVGPLGSVTDDLTALEESNVPHPLLQDANYLSSMSQALNGQRPTSRRNTGSTSTSGWLSVVHLAWSVQMLHRVVSHGGLPATCTFTTSDAAAAERQEMLQREENNFWEEARDAGVFFYLTQTLITLPGFMKENHWRQRVHSLLTDLIAFMPSQVRSLRLQDEESSRLAAMPQQAQHMSNHSFRGVPQEGNFVAVEEVHHFESLLHLLADFYSAPENKELCEEYWSGGDLLDSGGAVAGRSTQDILNMSSSVASAATTPYHRLFKQRCLFRFVRFTADVASCARLYIAYLRMLSALSSSPCAASLCFHLLKMNSMASSQYNAVSWEHFFTTLRRYCEVLRNPASAVGAMHMGDHETQTLYGHLYGSGHRTSLTTSGGGVTATGRRYHSAALTCRIKPEELHALLAVLQLLRKVTEEDEETRKQLAEHPTWQPINLLMTMLTLPFPHLMKAHILRALAAFARTPNLALFLWQELSASGIISYRSNNLSTMPQNVHTHPGMVARPSGLHTELEELEPMWEEFSLSTSFVQLLHTLCRESHTREYGLLQPPLLPAIKWMVEALFLKHHLRAYKRPMEQWELACQFVSILLEQVRHFIHLYVCMEPKSMANHPQAQLHAGYYVITQLLSDTPLFRMMLQLCHQSLHYLQQYSVASHEEHCDPVLHLSHLLLRCFSLLLAHEDALREVVNHITGSVRSLLWSGESGAGGGGGGPVVLQQMATAGVPGTAPMWNLPASRFSKLLLLSVNPATNQADYLATIALFTTFAPDYPTLCREALIILKFAVSLIQPHEELLPHLTYNEDVPTQLQRALVQCMEATNTSFPLEEEYAHHELAPMNVDLPENCSQLYAWLAKTSESRCSTQSPSLQCLAVELLLQSVTLRGGVFTLAHLMLGFEAVVRLIGAPTHQLVTAMRKTVLQEPGMAGASRTCLHALILILLEEQNDMDVEVSTTEESQCACSAAYVRTVCGRILHQLCAHTATAEPVLRFLRGTYDFFPKLLARWSMQLPVVLNGEGAEDVQRIALAARMGVEEEELLRFTYLASHNALTLAFRGWILKSISIELRLVLQLQNRSYALRLLQLLFGSKFSSLAACEQESVLQSDVMSRLAGSVEETPLQMKLLQQLNLRETSPASVLEPMELNARSLLEMLRPLEEHLLIGGRFVNTTRLLGRLRVEKNEEAVVAQSVDETMHMVCVGAERYNVHCLMREGASLQCVEGWRQVMEVVLSCAVLGIKLQSTALPPQTSQWPLVAGSVAVTHLCADYMDLLLHKLHEGGSSIMVSIAMLCCTSVMSLSHTVSQSCSLAVEQAKRVATLQGLSRGTGTDADTASSHYISQNHLRALHRLAELMKKMALLIVVLRNGSPRLRSYLYSSITFILQLQQSVVEVEADWHTMCSTATGFDVTHWLLQMGGAPSVGGKEDGSSVCSVVYDDICSGHSVSRMSGICFMDSLLSVATDCGSTSSHNADIAAWMHWLMRSGNVEDMIHTVLELARVVERHLRNESVSTGKSAGGVNILESGHTNANVTTEDVVAPFYLLHTLLALLARMALTGHGARLLLQCNLPIRLSKCNLVDLLPWSRDTLTASLVTAQDHGTESGLMLMDVTTADDTNDDMLLEWNQLQLGMIRLLCNLLTTLGVGHVQAQEQVAVWFSAHQEHLLKVLHYLHARSLNEWLIRQRMLSNPSVCKTLTSPLVNEVLEVSALLQLLLATECSTLGVPSFFGVQQNGARDGKQANLGMLVVIEETVLTTLESLVENHMWPHLGTSRQCGSGGTGTADPGAPVQLDIAECSRQGSLSVGDIVRLVRSLLTCCVTRCQAGDVTKKRFAMFSPPLGCPLKGENWASERPQSGVSQQCHLYQLMGVLYYMVALYRTLVTSGCLLWTSSSSSSGSQLPPQVGDVESGMPSLMTENEIRHREEQLRSVWCALRGVTRGEKVRSDPATVSLRDMSREVLLTMHLVIDCMEMGTFLLWDSLRALLSSMLNKQRHVKFPKGSGELSGSANGSHKTVQREVVTLLGSGWLLEVLSEISTEVNPDRRSVEGCSPVRRLSGTAGLAQANQKTRPDEDHLLAVMCHNLHRLTMRCEQNLREANGLGNI